MPDPAEEIAFTLPHQQRDNGGAHDPDDDRGRDLAGRSAPRCSAACHRSRPERSGRWALEGAPVLQHFADEPRFDAPAAFAIGQHQRLVAEDIDEPRDAAGGAMDDLQGPLREDRRVGHTCDLEAMPDVLHSLGIAERLELSHETDALAKLAELGPAQLVAKFRLAYEQDLDQLAARRL